MVTIKQSPKAGDRCPRCGGTGATLTSADAHRSEGWIPCTYALYGSLGPRTPELMCHQGTLVSSRSRIGANARKTEKRRRQQEALEAEFQTRLKEQARYDAMPMHEKIEEASSVADLKKILHEITSQ